MDIMEILEPIAAACAYVITIVSLLTILFKPIRRYLVSKILNKYIETKEEEQIESSFNELKNMIQVVTTGLQISAESCNKNQVAIQELMVALQSSIRNTITHIYYKYTAEDSIGIPIYEKENIIYLYEAYTEILKGNSFVKEIYEELMELPVIKNSKK